jgi:hypothetical protein
LSFFRHLKHNAYLRRDRIKELRKAGKDKDRSE